MNRLPLTAICQGLTYVVPPTGYRRWMHAGSAWLLASALLLMGCANPVPPSGGPRDTTPPAVVESRPAEGEVNVEQDVTVEVIFSEYIERGSFSQALSVTPALDGQAPEVDHDGRSATISFPEPLRDNTTYIITLDTNLRDARNVALEAPITLAFSTGPTINRGTLSGRVVDADSGAPREGIDVYAYALDRRATAGRAAPRTASPDRAAVPGVPSPDSLAVADTARTDPTAADSADADTTITDIARADTADTDAVTITRRDSSAAAHQPVSLPDSLPDRPAYRTQTDSDGQFQFNYLREQPYYVVALADANRNRQPDASEAFAVPPMPTLVADSAGTSPSRPWVATLRDTIPPEPVRVQSRSRRRHAVRFDTPVQLLDRTASRWALRDSVRAEAVATDAVYQRGRDPRLVLLRTPPLNPNPHRLIIPSNAVADSSGNLVPTDTLRFTPADVADTLQTRFVRFMPTGLTPDTAGVYTLLPDEQPGVRLNQPIDSTQLRTVVTARDSVGNARSFTLSTADGTAYRLRFTPPLAPTERVDVRVGGPPLARTDTAFTRPFRRIANRQLGSLSGTVSLTPGDSAQARPAEANSARSLPAPIVVELIMEGTPPRLPPRQVTADSTGTFLFPRLPEGDYRFRAFLDVNQNGQWDGGQILPYVPAEPITWSDGTIGNRPRWENVLEAPLRLARPADP